MTLDELISGLGIVPGAFLIVASLAGGMKFKDQVSVPLSVLTIFLAGCSIYSCLRPF